MSARSSALVASAALLTGLVLSGCGASHEEDADAVEAPHQQTCVADAKPVDVPSRFPSQWPLPPSTVVTDVEDRDGGVIVSAVTSTSLEDVLAFLNGDVADAGFAVTSGETEEHDAEANWSGNGYHGRWAIRDSSACAGETELQVFAVRS